MKIDPTTLVLTAVLLAPTGYLLAGPSRGGDATHDYFPDDTITTQIETAVRREDLLKSAAVRITTYRGAVYLAGSVDTREQLTRAEDIASHVQGVREVRSHLKLKQAKKTQSVAAL